MNLISKHMEKEIRKIQSIKSQESKDFDYKLLVSNNFKIPNKNEIEKVKLLFKEYKSLKRSLKNPRFENEDLQYSTVNEVFKYINSKAYSAINSNQEELCNTMIYCAYNVLGAQSKSFLWNCFGQEIYENAFEKKKDKFVKIPMPSKNGNIEYLWKKYGVFTINTEWE